MTLGLQLGIRMRAQTFSDALGMPIRRQSRFSAEPSSHLKRKRYFFVYERTRILR
jgi:hypothetical protein